ncbi:hypothetical protein SpAn4DRAFT_4109 [Sporomusa ovata]|uniref:Uncharacterized protein n=1 Tax=Sporomusa ovata TaxID=2378 RepID=A0A0U1L4W5_9FIRM|nr:hypothetical protein SpAn4DRAFT_4109 [Sporomusa ovata]
MEVANWTSFDESFSHASTGHPPKGEEKAVCIGCQAIGEIFSS